MRMIERVARAICSADGIDPDCMVTKAIIHRMNNGLTIKPEEYYWSNAWMLYEDHARAAIEAMRVPTQAMQDDGDLTIDADPNECWRVMIDAALQGSA